MKIVTWNVNGFGRARASAGTARPPNSRTSSVSRRSRRRRTRCRCCSAAEGYWCYWHGAEDTRGWRCSCAALHAREPGSPIRRSIMRAAWCGRAGGTVAVASVYVPNGGKDFPAKSAFSRVCPGTRLEHARGAARHLGRPQHGPRRTGRASQGAEPNQIGPAGGARAVRADRSKSGLVDIGRALDPENDGLFTWWAPWRNLRQRNIGWRIDYVLASRRSPARARARRRREFGTSDHAPVVATFHS